jgi:hypothetical protein
MLTEPIRTRPGERGRRIVQLPYSPDHVAKIKTMDGCVQADGFGQAPPVTRFAIPLRRTCWRTATTSDSSGAPRHTAVKTTIVYTHVLNRGGRGVRSPVDDLERRPAC